MSRNNSNNKSSSSSDGPRRRRYGIKEAELKGVQLRQSQKKYTNTILENQITFCTGQKCDTLLQLKKTVIMAGDRKSVV